MLNLENTIWIGCQQHAGGPEPGCEQAAETIKTALCPEAQWTGFTPNLTNPLETIEKHYRNCVTAIKPSAFHIILGGDHSIAIGTWRAFQEKFRDEKRLRLLWIDAHLDAHTPASSHTGNIHGMPVSALLGDNPLFPSNQPTFFPEELTLLGYRSFEREEKIYLEQKKVCAYASETVKNPAILHDVLDTFAAYDGPFGISLDIDVFDPTYCPAVSTPVPDGLHPDLLLPGLHALLKKPNCVGIEIVEFVPSHDYKDESLNIIKSLLIGYSI